MGDGPQSITEALAEIREKKGKLSPGGGGGGGGVAGPTKSPNQELTVFGIKLMWLRRRFVKITTQCIPESHAGICPLGVELR
jgi:hypothetical protein